MKYLRVSKGKTRRFFPCGAFFSHAVGEYSSKFPNSKKNPLPWKIPGYAPAKYKRTSKYQPIIKKVKMENRYFW